MLTIAQEFLLANIIWDSLYFAARDEKFSFGTVVLVTHQALNLLRNESNTTTLILPPIHILSRLQRFLPIG